ncbi:MAG: hypothetical protein J6X35_02305, partial [Bacteroidales bacterium]|nr:hypothetical protein [Bacteroidales bacterium]
NCSIFMGDKRDFNAFCGAADITLCGLSHAEGAKYVPPAAEVMIFALEKGFATSVTLGVSSNGASEHNNTPQPFTTNDSWSTHGWD